MRAISPLTVTTYPRPTFNRFCDAMINIRREAEDVITGKQPQDNNVLKNAPHPMSVIALSEEEWNRCVNYRR